MKSYQSLLIFLFFLVSCNLNSLDEMDTFSLELDPRLSENEKGLYILELDSSRNQTIHRISGQLLKNGEEPNPPEKVSWDSNLTWTLNDTTFIIQRRFLNSLGEWVVVDTSYVIGFSGEIVPTINETSYSGKDGEINTVIAPIYSMKGDTMVVRCKVGNLESILYILLK